MATYPARRSAAPLRCAGQGVGRQLGAGTVASADYVVKRRLRLPLIWWGRWRHRNDSPAMIARLERHGYRRTVQKSADDIGFDPNYLYRADLDESSLILDVGGYQGEIAAKLHGLYGCTIHVFEPSPLNRGIEARFADEPDITSHPYGLGGSDATLEMQLSGPGSTVFGAMDGSEQVVEVQIRDVAEVLEELGVTYVDYCKINIEGGEFELIPRLIDTGWIDRTRYLLIQFHEWIPHAHRMRRKIRRDLKRTHDQVWCYPWIYELWCAKDRPHPQPPKFSKADLEKLRAEWIAIRDAQSDGTIP